MLQITPQHRLLLAVEPIDFRKGICALKALCQQKLLCDPFSGTVFAFANRARTSVKLLVYDASGFWLCHRNALAKASSPGGQMMRLKPL
jgi:transposase